MIKGDTLTLAGPTKLLPHRLPEGDAAEWIKLSAEARGAGADLSRAARAEEFLATGEDFKLLFNRGNARHDRSVDGGHQPGPQPGDCSVGGIPKRWCDLQTAGASLGFAHYETDWNF